MPEVLHFVGISKHLLQLGRVAVCFPVLDSVAVGHAITYASHLDLLRLLINAKARKMDKIPIIFLISFNRIRRYLSCLSGE